MPFLLNAACLAEKQQSTIYRNRGEHSNHYTTDEVPIVFECRYTLIMCHYCIEVNVRVNRGVIKNEQSRDIDNIGPTIDRTKTNKAKKHNITQKSKNSEKPGKQFLFLIPPRSTQ